MKRVTENGKQRVTEQGQVRILETDGKSEPIAQIVADAVARLRKRGEEPKVRVTVEERTVRAFDGTKVRVATEIIGTPAD